MDPSGGTVEYDQVAPHHHHHAGDNGVGVERRRSQSFGSPRSGPVSAELEPPHTRQQRQGAQQTPSLSSPLSPATTAQPASPLSASMPASALRAATSSARGMAHSNAKQAGAGASTAAQSRSQSTGSLLRNLALLPPCVVGAVYRGRAVLKPGQRQPEFAPAHQQPQQQPQPLPPPPAAAAAASSAPGSPSDVSAASSPVGGSTGHAQPAKLRKQRSLEYDPAPTPSESNPPASKRSASPLPRSKSEDPGNSTAGSTTPGNQRNARKTPLSRHSSGAGSSGASRNASILQPNIPRAQRQAFVDDAIQLCLSARQAERVSTELTVSVAADRIAFTTHDADSGDRVLWSCAKRNTMFCSVGRRRADCFVVVRKRHADVVAEVLQAPSPQQASECMAALASAFGAAPPTAPTATLSQQRSQQQRQQQVQRVRGSPNRDVQHGRAPSAGVLDTQHQRQQQEEKEEEEEGLKQQRQQQGRQQRLSLEQRSGSMEGGIAGPHRAAHSQHFSARATSPHPTALSSVGHNSVQQLVQPVQGKRKEERRDGKETEERTAHTARAAMGDNHHHHHHQHQQQQREEPVSERNEPVCPTPMQSSSPGSAAFAMLATPAAQRSSEHSHAHGNNQKRSSARHNEARNKATSPVVARKLSGGDGAPRTITRFSSGPLADPGADATSPATSSGTARGGSESAADKDASSRDLARGPSTTNVAEATHSDTASPASTTALSLSSSSSFSSAQNPVREPKPDSPSPSPCSSSPSPHRPSLKRASAMDSLALLADAGTSGSDAGAVGQAAAPGARDTEGDVANDAIAEVDAPSSSTVDFSARYGGYVESAPTTGYTRVVHRQAARLQGAALPFSQDPREVVVHLQVEGGFRVVEKSSCRVLCRVAAQDLLACTVEEGPSSSDGGGRHGTPCAHVCMSRRHRHHVFTHVLTVEDNDKAHSLSRRLQDMIVRHADNPALQSLAERVLIYDEMEGLDLQQKRAVLEQHIRTLRPGLQKTARRLFNKLHKKGMDDATQLTVLLDVLLQVKYSTGKSASFSNLKRTLTASLDSLLTSSQPRPSRRPGGSHLRTTGAAADGSSAPTAAVIATAPQWKQDIFNKVSSRKPHLVTPTRHRTRGRRSRLTSAEDAPRSEIVRQRWRKAVQQQLLLIRMRSQNDRLEQEAEEAAARQATVEQQQRQERAAQLWDDLLASIPASELLKDPWGNKTLLAALEAGVPKDRRPMLWLWMARARLAARRDVEYTYLDLLVEPCIYLHAIQIDIDRTFPEHPLFMGTHSTTKRALRNCMKAYSILDEDVGYCQGMTFVQALLLIHLSEEDAFDVFVALLYGAGLRSLYMPDMYALQRALYCFSRLLHDHVPDVFQHLDQYAVEAFLFATSWFLTFFNTPFSIQFADAIMDHLLVFGEAFLFRVGLALLQDARDDICRCRSFEETLRWLQTRLPQRSSERADAVLARARGLDLTDEQVRSVQEEYDAMQGAQASEPKEMQKLRRKNVFLGQHVNHAKAALQALRLERELWKTRAHALRRYAERMAEAMAAKGLQVPLPSEEDLIACEDQDGFDIVSSQIAAAHNRANATAAGAARGSGGGSGSQ